MPQAHVLTLYLFPSTRPRCRFVVVQDGVKCVVADGLVAALGCVYLSLQRIVFLGAGHLVTLPLVRVRRVALEQPIFSANYVHGRCTALPGSGLDSPDFSFRLEFTAGNAGTCAAQGLPMHDARARPRASSSSYPPLCAVTFIAQLSMLMAEHAGASSHMPTSSTCAVSVCSRCVPSAGVAGQVPSSAPAAGAYCDPAQPHTVLVPHAAPVPSRRSKKED